ncbi:MAG: hypothetical protein US49_C0005G0058 [candidate division TM6 bacterium GW2011_GWF2_37_49]|nr:MAG: hypothetical protein US49_C0005G0058 [candidate division TM6 bacterium GW2011_GWF2_37_49]
MKFNLKRLFIAATLIIGLSNASVEAIDSVSAKVIDEWISTGNAPRISVINSMTHVEWKKLVNKKCIPSLNGFDFKNKTYRDIAKAYFNQYFSRYFNSKIFRLFTWHLTEDNSFAAWVNPLPTEFKNALRLYYHMYMLTCGKDTWLDGIKLDIPVSFLVEHGIIPAPCQISLNELIFVEHNSEIEKEAELYAQHLINLEKLTTSGRLKVLAKKLFKKLLGKNSFGLSELKEIKIILNNLPKSFKKMVVEKYAQLTKLEGRLFAQDKKFKELASLKTLLDNPACKSKLMDEIEQTHKLDLTNKTMPNLDREELSLLGQDALNDIKELILCGNDFKALPSDVFCDLTNLEKIVISNNSSLEILPTALFRGNPKLKLVIISNNPNLKIDQTIFSDISPDVTLELLDLSNNNLQDGDLPYLASMPVKSINLSNNLLTTLPADLCQQPGWQAVETLNLSGNKIASLNSIADRSLQSLAQLDLSCNNGLMVTSIGLNGQPSIFWPKIETLILTDCDITKIDSTSFSSFPTLKELCLNKNKLQELAEEDVIPGFDRNTLLEELDLTQNELSAITPVTFQNLTNLKVLSLGSNNIKTITTKMFASLTQLKELNLENNGISNVEVDGLPSCKLIKFKGNNTHGLFRLLTSLRTTSSLSSTVEKEWYNRLHTILLADGARGLKTLKTIVQKLARKTYKQIVAQPEPKIEEIKINITPAIQAQAQQEVQVAQIAEPAVKIEQTTSRYPDLFVDVTSQPSAPKKEQSLYPDLAELNRYDQPEPSAPPAPAAY